MLTAADRFVDKEKKRLTTHLILGAGLLTMLLLAAVAPGSSLPTAENLGVDNANGYQYTTAVVPVVITNAQKWSDY